MTTLNQEFISQESTTNILHKAAICMAGVALGMWFLVSPEFWVDGQNLSTLGAQITGAFTAIGFGFIGLKTLFEHAAKKKAALRIDNQGLYAKTLSANPIPWDEIKSIKTEGSTAILQLKKEATGKFDRDRVFYNQNQIWSDMNIIRLSLIGYAHDPVEIGKGLKERFACYKRV